MIGDRFSDLALNREHVSQIAIISLRPKMGVGAGVDELSVNANVIGRALHASFQQVRDTELLSDLTKIARDATLIWRHRSTADDFQIRHLGKVGQDFILHAIGEVSVLFLITQIFEREHGDAFFSRAVPLRSAVPAEKPKRSGENGGNQNERAEKYSRSAATR